MFIEPGGFANNSHGSNERSEDYPWYAGEEIYRGVVGPRVQMELGVKMRESDVLGGWTPSV